MKFTQFAFVMTSCLAIGSAAAQPAASEAPSQSVLPGVLSTSAGATFDGRVDHSSFDDGELEGPTLLALALHGQYIARSGLGGYLSLPLAYAAADGESEAFLGNLELGGLYAIRSGIVEAYARGGLALDTSSGEDLDQDMVPISNIVPRPADAIPSGLGTSFLRTGGGLRLTSGAVVFGGSAGVDVPLGRDYMDGKVLHLTGSLGIAQPRYGLALGATMLQLLDAPAEPLVGFQGIGDVAVGGKMRLYGALGLNFGDSEAEDDTAFSVGVGVRTSL